MSRAFLFRIFSLAASVFCSFPLTAQTDDTGWQLRREENGISVYTRNLDNSPFDEYKATTVVYNIPIDSIYSLMTAGYGQRFSDKDPLIRKFEVLKVVNPQEYYTYAVMHLSLFQKDRDAIFRVNKRATSKGYIVEAQCIPEYKPAVQGLVRMGEGRTYYYLARREDGGVEVVLSGKFDLAGEIPERIVNKGLADSTYERLLFIRSQISSEFAANNGKK